MVQVSYPGVYVQEIPSGVRTITGVATSIAAFVGWAPAGPTDAATLVTSFADYVRLFGGLNKDSSLGYAVSQFFANGGQQAYIVALTTKGADAGLPATATLGDAKANPPSELNLQASSTGTWANAYSVASLRSGPFDAKNPSKTRFSLTVSKNGVAVEVFVGLSVDPNDERYVVSVLAAQSNLIRVSDPVASQPPPVGSAPPEDTAAPVAFAGGKDGPVLKPTDPAFAIALNPERSPDLDGVRLLETVDLFNLLIVPGFTDPTSIQNLEAFCRSRRAFYIVDSANGEPFTATIPEVSKIHTVDSSAAAIYYPWIDAPDPLNNNARTSYPPSGFVAGIYARTDGSRGVWKAPAGTEASLVGVLGPTQPLTDVQNGIINPKGVNAIRNFATYGTVVWGARTLDGDDAIGSEWKYIPVRRTAFFIEESLFRSLKWVVFEPNDEPLWAQIRLNVGAFMHDLFRQGAFQGTNPQDAYFVKCDKETTTQEDIDHGIVNIVVGFAPLKPAEFVIVTIQQIAGQIAA